jgi:hypothetical protein
MKITSLDFVGINTHGIPFLLNEAEGIVYINTDVISTWINKRPWYCNRGRYGFHVENIKGKVPVVDWADFFPRYFFKLDNLFDELNEWLKFNEIQLKNYK